MRAAGLLVTDELDRGAAPSAGALLPATREVTAAGQAPLTLLQHPAEVLVLRPGPDDHRVVTAGAVRGHF